MSEIADAARNLKYTTEIKRILAEEFSSSSEDFVRLIVKQVYKGTATPAVRKMFSALTHQALTQFINERVELAQHPILNGKLGEGKALQALVYELILWSGQGHQDEALEPQRVVQARMSWPRSQSSRRPAGRSQPTSL